MKHKPHWRIKKFLEKIPVSFNIIHIKYLFHSAQQAQSSAPPYITIISYILHKNPIIMKKINERSERAQENDEIKRQNVEAVIIIC